MLSRVPKAEPEGSQGIGETAKTSDRDTSYNPGVISVCQRFLKYKDCGVIPGAYCRCHAVEVSRRRNTKDRFGAKRIDRIQSQSNWTHLLTAQISECCLDPRLRKQKCRPGCLRGKCRQPRCFETTDTKVSNFDSKSQELFYQRVKANR